MGGWGITKLGYGRLEVGIWDIRGKKGGIWEIGVKQGGIWEIEGKKTWDMGYWVPCVTPLIVPRTVWTGVKK